MHTGRLQPLWTPSVALHMKEPTRNNFFRFCAWKRQRILDFRAASLSLYVCHLVDFNCFKTNHNYAFEHTHTHARAHTHTQTHTQNRDLAGCISRFSMPSTKCFVVSNWTMIQQQKTLTYTKSCYWRRSNGVIDLQVHYWPGKMQKLGNPEIIITRLGLRTPFWNTHVHLFEKCLQGANWIYVLYHAGALFLMLFIEYYLVS
jgi:hypothetical protein